jgi:plasmid stability protein
MPQLTVHNINPELVRCLESRAAPQGHSIEAEHLNMLQAALMDAAPQCSFKEALLSMPNVGEDADFERIQDIECDAPDFSA